MNVAAVAAALNSGGPAAASVPTIGGIVVAATLAMALTAFITP